MPSLAGTRIDKYEMLEEVGHGGMAVVYRGQDSVLEREVAVKVLHPHLADREESRQRLRREALAVAKLRHENILEIFDYSGAEADESYIVTEFIHGPTLREWIDESLDPRPAIAALIVHRLCLALGHAHKGGIVHRDIKPENVMIRSEDGCVKLMDFGIAQILDNQKLTLTGQLIGSPAYMAPELISGRPLDQRTDLFSLGILLYQLSTGELPFAGRNPHEVLNRIADGDYPAPSTICPLVDRDLEAIIAASLATSPDDRFQSVDTFAKELEQYLEEMGVAASPTELRGYFRNAKSYIAELDERVSAALMKRAQAVAKEGQNARAIALLGRVLELDGSHKEARALLDRLRRQEKRMRQLLVGAGSVAVVGLVAAGVVLVPPDAPRAEHLASETKTDGGGNGQVAVMPGTKDRKTPLPTKVPPEPDDGGDGGAEPVDPKTADAAVGGTKKKGGRPKRMTPKPDAVSSGTVDCTITIRGISPAQAKNFDLRVSSTKGGTNIKYNIPESLKVTAKYKGPGGWAEIGNEFYRGSVSLSPERCAKGVVLSANPKPAKITFKNLPPAATVQCVKGCPPKYPKGPQLPDKVKPVPMDGRQLRVRFAFKAENYIDATKDKNLTPGRNSWEVRLKHR